MPFEYANVEQTEHEWMKQEDEANGRQSCMSHSTSRPVPKRNFESDGSETTTVSSQMSVSEQRWRYVTSVGGQLILLKLFFGKTQSKRHMLIDVTTTQLQ